MEKRDFKPNSLREEFLAWKSEVQALSQKEKEGREELVILRKERDALQHELYDECLPRLEKVMNLQQQMVQSYQALLPAIETKKRLAAEVVQLKEELQERDKIHHEEMARLSSQLEATRAEEGRKQEEIIRKARFEASEKDAAHKKEEEALVAELQTTKQKHKEEFAEMRKKMHDEIEHYRNRITQLQQMRSSSATSNMDFFAGKLQATKEEYLKQIEDRNATIVKLQEEYAHLQEERNHYKEALKHQELLSVVRGVATVKEKPTAMPTPVLSPRSSPLLENPHAHEEDLDKEEGEISDLPVNDTGAGQSEDRQHKLPKNPKEAKDRKLTKRKLFAIEKTLQEMDA